MTELTVVVIVLAMTTVAVAVVKWRSTVTEAALLQQNRELFDLAMSLIGDERGWLAHRREMERTWTERRQAVVQEPDTVPVKPFSDFEVEGPRTVDLPGHGGLPG